MSTFWRLYVSKYLCRCHISVCLSHTRSMNKFYHSFTTLSNRVIGLSIDKLLDCVLSGLKPKSKDT